MVVMHSCHFFLVIALVSGMARPPIAVAQGTVKVDFGRDIRPILSENCFQCHGPDARARQADLRLDLSRSALEHDPPILVAGQPDRSPLWKRVSSGNPDTKMPPPGSNRQLSDREIQLLRVWIPQRAEFQGH